MFHSAVDQAPGVPLHAGRQATGELRGRKRLMILRSDVTLLTVAAWCNLPGTFSMSVSCSRSLASLSIGRASNDKSQSQLPKLCLRLASSMVMILEKRSRCANQRTTTQCVCVCSLRLLSCTHLPATRGRVTKEVVDHVQLILLHNNKSLFSSLLSIHIRRPLDEK